MFSLRQVSRLATNVAKEAAKPAVAAAAAAAPSAPAQAASEPPVAAETTVKDTVDVETKGETPEVHEVKGVQVSGGISQEFVSEPRKSANKPRVSFKISTPGLAAIIHATIPLGAKMSAVHGTVLGMSRGLSTSSEFFGNPAEVALRMAAGGSVRRHCITADREAGDALIAPRQLGDVAVIHMEKGYPLRVRLGSLLATADEVVISTRPEHALTGGRWVTEVTGQGDLAITSYGAIFRVSLGDDDAYYIDPRNLIAWSSTVAEVSEETRSFVGRILDKFWKPVRSERPAGLICVKGPGDLFLQSRNRTSDVVRSPNIEIDSDVEDEPPVKKIVRVKRGDLKSGSDGLFDEIATKK